MMVVHRDEWWKRLQQTIWRFILGKKGGPVPFAVATPSADFSKKLYVSVLAGGVRATSSKTATRHGTGVTQKRVTT